MRYRGIGFSINVMFGLDGDRPDIFEATANFLIWVKVPVSFMFILTPRSGTKVRDQLLSKNRIFGHNLDQLLWFKVVYQPQHITVNKLEEGSWRANHRFYSPLAILQH